jgi:calcineurin-like phosphoesterase family protein
MKFKVSHLRSEPQIYVMSDPHYNHTNICRGVSKWGDDDLTRDFPTLEKMNDTIVNNINSKVGQDDILFCLGDWSFGGFDSIKEFRDRIVCKNIHLILGNHDHHIERNKEGIRTLFSSVNHYLRIQVSIHPGSMLYMGDYQFVLCHFPIASWDNMNKGVIHLHGHVHLPSHLKISAGKAMDVGMDGNDLMPYSIKEIVMLMNKQPIAKLSLPIDHHEKEVR